MVKAGDQRQKSPTNLCCLLHSFGIFQLISAGSCVSVLLKERRGLNNSSKASALPQTFALDGLHGMKKAGSALEHLAWRLATGTTSAWVSSFWRPVLRGRPWALCLQGHQVAAGNPKTDSEKRMRLQSHLSLLCLPSYRWFPAQQLVLFYLLPWVFTPLLQHAGTFCCCWPFGFHSKDQALEH